MLLVSILRTIVALLPIPYSNISILFISCCASLLYCGGSQIRCGQDFIGDRCQFKSVFEIIEELKSTYLSVHATEVEAERICTKNIYKISVR